MRLSSLFIAGIALFYAVSASAEAPKSDSAEKQAPEKVVAQAKKPSPNKKVCRKVKVTGSHFKQRVCMKQKEWDKLREGSQDLARDMNQTAI